MRSFITLPILALPFLLNGQTLFTENFESAPAFALNTTDVGSVSGVSNSWLINNTYAGGTGTADCLGFPIDFTVPGTPNEPIGITPQDGNYLHVASLAAIANGIQCCSFATADGVCTSSDDVFARMTTDVSTVGSSTATLSFWWLCDGGNQNYGQVYYSINGGTSWTQVTTPISQYRNQPNWIQETITLNAFGGHATLRFGFRFHNGQSTSANDPGFAVDDVRISLQGGGTTSIATSSMSTPLCAGDTINVGYTITGIFSAGNMFTAQLSNAGGSFASPTDIGSIASTSAGTVASVIPSNTTGGSGYRIRVTGSSPTTVGTDNGADITIGALPNAGADVGLTACIGATIDLNTLLVNADPGGMWSGGTNMITVVATAAYIYTVSNSCGSDQAVFHVNAEAPPHPGNDTLVHICKNTGDYPLIDLLGGAPQTGGTWTGPDAQPTDPVFNSDIDLAGTYTYTVTSGCGNADAVVSVVLGNPGNAGPNADWMICSSDLPTDLYAHLVGANTGGVWFQGGVPISGTITAAGSFVYVDYPGTPCPNDTALITVSVVDSANAGVNTSITLCINGPAQPLFPLINGSPDMGGYWLDPNSFTFGGVFIPGTSQTGLYTYTVPGTGPCPADVAEIAVGTQVCIGIEEFHRDAIAISWTGVDEQGAYLFATPFSSEVDAQVIDASGRVLRDEHTTAFNGRLRIAMDAFAPGVYVLRAAAKDQVGFARFIRVR